MIELLREYRPDRTLGWLTLENGTELCTIELPWIQNMQRVSCIPEGVYGLKLRESPVIHRTSRGAFQKGWEVTNVPGRTYIMMHIANFPRDVLGCIGIGMKHGQLPGRDGIEAAVLQSRIAFEYLMKVLAEREEWYLEIKAK